MIVMAGNILRASSKVPKSQEMKQQCSETTYFHTSLAAHSVE